MGNTVVWKPASTAAVSAYWIMRLLQEAGLPDGVINLVYGDGKTVGDAALASEHLAGVHFTGSTPVFQGMWKTIGGNIERYRNYPRIVGETGGKDFILAHPSADAEAVVTAIVRGSFEYQGQKCSAASRIYAPVEPVVADARPPRRRGGHAEDGRRHRLLELHGRGHRREGMGRATGTRSKRRRRRAAASSSAARPTTARASSSSRP